MISTVKFINPISWSIQWPVSVRAARASRFRFGTRRHGLPAHAEGEVNIYSSRHYDTDERLYSDFTDATGIRST
jgi:hypothetical protein